MIRIANNQSVHLRKRCWAGLTASSHDSSNIYTNSKEKGHTSNRFEASSALVTSQQIHTFHQALFSTNVRNFSSSPAAAAKAGDDGTFYDLSNNSNLPTFEESIATLSGQNIEESSVEATSEIVESVASVAGTTFDPTWYSVSDQAVTLVQYVHETTGLQYATSIFALTIAIRLALFPLMAMSQRNMSRMAHMKPELEIVTEKMKALPSDASMEERTRVQRQYNALMEKYDAKPMRSVLVMVAQAPIFIGMFFGMQAMPEFFPELASGGMFWFTDLTIPDPLYILPCITAATFVAGVEVNKDLTIASNPAQGPIMINAMRGMGLLMIPFTASFPTIVFCYWVANNSFTFLQMMAFKQPAIRNYFDIWDAPKPVPGNKQKSMKETYEDWSSTRGKEKQEKEKRKKIFEHNKRMVERRPRSRRKK